MGLAERQSIIIWALGMEYTLMHIEIICVGKLKERYMREAVQEYCKRLSRHCKTAIFEVKDEAAPVNSSFKEEEQILLVEGERITKQIKPDSYVIALDLKGEQVSSEALAERLQHRMLQGSSHFTFIIGGSLGLHSSIVDSANWRLSFSRMTFPHQLMRVILCEQLYRSFTIIKGEPYHK